MRPALELTYLAGSLLAAALIGSGCGGGGSGPDGAAPSEEFGKRAGQSYADQGLDRDQDFARGIPGDDCFVLDEQGAKELGAALGGSEGDYQADQGSFLTGPPEEEERLSCTIGPGGGAPAVGGLNAGSTLLDAEGLRARVLRQEGATEIDGEASDLDSADVVAVEVETAQTYAWVSDDFSIGITGPAEELGDGAGFEALSVAVDAVSATLDGGS